MNKKQQEVQHRKEDQALMRGMLWAAGAVVLEALLFLLNRYAFDYNATMEGVLLAEKLRVVLKAMRAVGMAAFVVGAAAAVSQKKKNADAFWAGLVSLLGLMAAICGHVCAEYHGSGVRMLYLLVPVLGGLAMCYYIYPRDFFLCALPCVVGALGLWFVRAGGVGPEVIATVLVCVAALIAVVKLKKNNGEVVLAGMKLRVAEEKIDYTVPVISAVAALAVQAVAAVAGGTVAYYLIFVMGAWLFALLVYHTVKML